MDRVMMLDHNIESIGLYTRSVTEGDELELVKEFIEYYIHIFLKNNKVNNLAVFVEPRIASGFPDIVFASYSTKILDDWSDKREKLDTNDLKVLSHLILLGGCTGDDLMVGLKLCEKAVLQALEDLLDSKMIWRSQGLWKPVDMKKIYHIKRLVSVEAKMADMKKVAEQSLINTWFASQSYALVNTANPQTSTIKSFERQGTGLYCKQKGFKKVVEAQKLKLHMKKFQGMCLEEFDNANLLKRGGQKVVFDGEHKIYKDSVIKLYFQLNDPRALREIQIEKALDLPMVPQIYDTGTIEYEGAETLYINRRKNNRNRTEAID